MPMTFQARLEAVVSAVSARFKQDRTLINGNVADLSALQTRANARADLVSAINDVLATRQANLGFTPENAASKGIAGGYAGLDGQGKVPASQLPAFVDDVLEYANLAAFPAQGSGGILYVSQANGNVYRWSGSAYVQIVGAPGSTDAVVEGAVNLYFTAARAVAALQPILGNPDTDLVAVFNAGLN